jgi:hypothetical protein
MDYQVTYIAVTQEADLIMAANFNNSVLNLWLGMQP